MKNRTTNFLAWAFVLSVALIGLCILVGIVWGLGTLDCRWRWSGAYQSSFGLGGCKVKIGEKWIPEDRVRAID